MTNPSTVMGPRIWRQRAGLFGGATVLAVLTFTQQWFAFSAEGGEFSPLFVALWSMTPWYFWAAVATRVAWLGRRVPTMRGNLLRAIPTHLGAALGLGLASSVVIVILVTITGTAPGEMHGTPFWVLCGRVGSNYTVNTEIPCWLQPDPLAARPVRIPHRWSGGNNTQNL